MKKKVFLVLLVFLMSLFADDLKDGMQALKEKKYEVGLQLLQKSCKELNAEACFQIGDIYNKGSGIEESEVEARSYYLKACKLKLQKACDADDALDSDC